MRMSEAIRMKRSEFIEWIVDQQGVCLSDLSDACPCNPINAGSDRCIEHWDGFLSELEDDSEDKSKLDELFAFAAKGYTVANEGIHAEKIAQNLIKEAQWKGEHVAYRCVMTEINRLFGKR